jgi:anti-sigma28 factor (negative regulator of flagellin synthesis)
MNNVGSVGSAAAAYVRNESSAAALEQEHPERTTPSVADQVELSDAARSDEAVLQQRIADIRARIAAGTYLTPDKLEVAVAHLLEALR